MKKLGRGTSSERDSRGYRALGRAEVIGPEALAKEPLSLSGCSKYGMGKEASTADFAHVLWRLAWLRLLFRPELNSVSQTNCLGILSCSFILEDRMGDGPVGGGE